MTNEHNELPSTEDLRSRLQRFVDDATRTEPSPEQYEEALGRLMASGRAGHRVLRLLHVAMGLCTEAGEFIDILKKHIFYGKELDVVHLMEELGDSSWYERVGVDVLEITYLDMLQRNVDKLKARFPQKFTEEHAVNRDLKKEREALEARKHWLWTPHQFSRMTHLSLCSLCGRTESFYGHVDSVEAEAVESLGVR